MIALMFITSDPQMGRFVADCGVDRVFVDLEIMGKLERQGHVDSHIGYATLDDVAPMRRAIGDTTLLVRLNPLHEGTAAEVEAALAGGADLLMLPMFRSAAELAEFSRLVAGRVGIIPLVETRGAADDLPAVCHVPGLAEVYIGLNDLHLEMGDRFMFEALGDGRVERMAELIRAAGLPFGFGGVARMDEGELTGRNVLAEHVRLGSASVILSRTFHRRSQGVAELQAQMDLGKEIETLRRVEQQLRRRTPAQAAADAQRTRQIIRAIAEQRGRT